MSPADRAGSVSAISPRHSSLQKFRCVHMRRRAGPVTEISVFSTEISVTELEMFSVNTPARIPGLSVTKHF